MTNRPDLEAAAAAGVISAEQANALSSFLEKGGTPAAPGAGEEDLRFIRNFHDVFLAIGIALFAIGMAIGIATLVGQGAITFLQGIVSAGVLCLAAAAVMWVLGELFARRRRLFLPAIATVIAFTGFMTVAVASLHFGVLLGRTPHFELGDALPPNIQAGLLLTAAMLAIAPGLFYLRFRLPFAIGMTASGLAMFALAVALLFLGKAIIPLLSALMLVLGLALFVVAVAFDARDPQRMSRMSDNGFWIHFAAAPLILNGAFGLLNQAFMGEGAAGGAGGLGGLLVASASGANTVALAAATLVVVVLLGVVSLLINRRVLIVSALLTTGVAIGIILQKLGMGAGGLAAATLITLGAFVLILGAGWHGVRRALLGGIKPGGLWTRIFPPEPAT